MATHTTIAKTIEAAAIHIHRRDGLGRAERSDGRSGGVAGCSGKDSESGITSAEDAFIAVALSP